MCVYVYVFVCEFCVTTFTGHVFYVHHNQISRRIFCHQTTSNQFQIMTVFCHLYFVTLLSCEICIIFFHGTSL